MIFNQSIENTLSFLERNGFKISGSYGTRIALIVDQSNYLIEETYRLKSLLATRGIKVEFKSGVGIQAWYDLIEDKALIWLIGVDDSILRLE